jgi:OTU domain-containing protein 3
MLENQDHFKFFIEDDVTFEDYIKDMSKDTTWGGNLEIYALSMKFTVNFYIYIYNHPMYIVKNFANPTINVHLTYHDGQHYNSVRLKADLAEDLPEFIPLEMINCVEQSTSMKAPDHEEANEDGEADSIEEEPKEEEEVVVEKNTNIASGEILINGTSVKDFKDKENKKDKFKKCILTQEGIILEEIKDLSKCHCETNKKYKNCCVSEDIKGEFDKKKNIYYCDLEVFKSRFHYEMKDKEELKISKNNSNGEVAAVTKQMERIFI